MAPPAPAKPLDIQDTDYPLESLLAAEEGKVQINLIVNAQGKVSVARLLTPSKLPRLENQAIAIARTRWEFTPAMRDGMPTAGSLDVDVNWKLPLLPAYEFQMLASDIPVGQGLVDFKEAIPITSQVFAPDEYPPGARALRRRGVIIFRYLILEDGTIGETKVIRSTGFSDLDEQAIKLVKSRWRYQPATINGKTVASWQYYQITFDFSNLMPRDRLIVPQRLCTSEPMLGGTLSVAAVTAPETVGVGQRIHLTAQGTVDDVIVRTKNGWMRYDKALVEQFNRGVHYPSATEGHRPDSCWFNADVGVRSITPESTPVALTPHFVPPNDYPSGAIERREQGVVQLRYFVQADGDVGEVQIATSSGYSRLDDAAIKIAKTWRFTPAAPGGNPVGMWINEDLRFRFGRRYRALPVH